MLMTVLFFLLAATAFISSLFLIFHPRTLPACLGMAGSMVSLGCVYSLLHFPFFTFVQLILYAGAVMVMIIYLVMSQGFEERGKESGMAQTVSAYLLSVVFLFLFSKIIGMSALPAWDKAEKSFGSVRDLGVALIKTYAVPFEILSVLLVAAMAGAVVLAKRSLK